MGRTLSFTQKVTRIVLALILVAGLGTGAAFGISQLFGNKPEPKQEALDGLTDGTKTEEDEDDLTVDLSRDGADNKYGKISKYVLQSSFLDMGKIRVKLTGIGQPVSIPMSGNQEWVDNQRRSDMPETTLYEVLEAKVAEWETEFSKLKGNELEVAIRDKVKEEIMRNPVFGDMMAQAFMTYPQAVEQNPWLVDFKKNLDEAYSRKEGDGKLVGLNAFMHYETKEAKEAKDFSKLMINTEANEKTGALEYFYPAAQLAELFDEFFEFDGKKDKLESAENWSLEANGDAAMQRTKQSNEQEDRAVYVFTHYTKMRNVSMRIGFNALDRRVELFKDTPQQKTKDTPNPNPDPDPDPDPNVEKFLVTVKYVYEDGSQAAATYSQKYAKGSFYKVASPKANKAGYTPDRAVVEGGPVTKAVNETVTYYKDNVKLYTGTINYLYRADGSQAAPTFSKRMKDGEKVTRQSPNIPNYTASKAEVILEIKGGDETVNVYYDRIKRQADYALTLKCVGTDGTLLRIVPKGRYAADETFTVYAESIPNWTARQSSVSGKMPAKDHIVTIEYTKNNPEIKTYPATLTHYDKTTGHVFSTDNLGNYEKGATVTGYAKSIDGYTAETPSVSGTMKEGGLNLRIGYDRIKDGTGDKKPEADPENAPGYDPGIGDNKPTDGPGNNESEKPAVNDHDNTPPKTPSMPNDNRNDEGQDTSKPKTDPIVDKATDTTVIDADTKKPTETKDEPINKNKVTDDDVMQYAPQGRSVTPSAQAQEVTPAPAAESRQVSQPAPQKQEVATEVTANDDPGTYEPEAVDEPAAQSVDEPVAQASEPAPQNNDGAGDYEETP